MDLDELPVEVRSLTTLPYTIHSSSGYTASYSPEHILVDNPSDQSSRWTGAIADAGLSSSRTNGGNDSLSARYDKYVMIKLDQPSDVCFIGFGKYFKVHPCNLSSFAVYGGLSPAREDQHLLYYGGLRNDTDKEKFKLDTTIKYRGEDYSFPVQYIRIDAIAAHSQSYNVSIWHVWLEGCADKPAVDALYKSYAAYRTQLTSDMVLSYLRQNRSLDLFEKGKSDLTAPNLLEHPLLSRLHETFVVKGDFEQAESILSEFKRQGLFEWWTRTKARPKARWIEIRQVGDGPGPRGGHQMARSGRCVLLHGGWDGRQDLDDLWQLDLEPYDSGQTAKWRRVDASPRPRARSCHQMAVDHANGFVYMLGGMAPVPPANGPESTTDGPKERYANDFWMFDPFVEQWTELSKDVAAEDGPPLIFDHQMVVQPGVGLYVFGGKIAQSSGADEFQFNTFWLYHFRLRKWKRLLNDAAPGSSLAELRAMTTPCGRIGHAALYDAQRSSIRLISGQRGDSYMTDVWDIRLNTDSTQRPFANLSYEKLTSDFTTGNTGPFAGFTQRLVRLSGPTSSDTAVLMSGLVRKDAREQPTSDIWLCRLDKRGDDKHMWTPVEVTSGPTPRYGAQCLDLGNGQILMFGGNPGETADRRLGDLWRLSIDQPTDEWALRKAMFALRRQRFSELCQREPSVLALSYLQNAVASVVNHHDPSESDQFRQCMKDLLSVPAANERANEVTEMEWEQHQQDDEEDQQDDGPSLPKGLADGSFYDERQQVFERISAMLNPADRPPLESLVDILGASRRHWE